MHSSSITSSSTAVLSPAYNMILLYESTSIAEYSKCLVNESNLPGLHHTDENSVQGGGILCHRRYQLLFMNYSCCASSGSHKYQHTPPCGSNFRARLQQYSTPNRKLAPNLAYVVGDSSSREIRILVVLMRIVVFGTDTARSFFRST